MLCVDVPRIVVLGTVPGSSLLILPLYDAGSIAIILHEDTEYRLGWRSPQAVIRVRSAGVADECRQRRSVWSGLNQRTMLAAVRVPALRAAWCCCPGAAPRCCARLGALGPVPRLRLVPLGLRLRRCCCMGGRALVHQCARGSYAARRAALGACCAAP
jgi:hypothetical protein